MERMSNAINAQVEELREHLKIYYKENSYLDTRLDQVKRDNDKLEEENKKLREENEKLKETIKGHQLYEEKLEHRIIEFEELLHGE